MKISKLIFVAALAFASSAGFAETKTVTLSVPDMRL